MVACYDFFTKWRLSYTINKDKTIAIKNIELASNRYDRILELIFNKKIEMQND